MKILSINLSRTNSSSDCSSILIKPIIIQEKYDLDNLRTLNLNTVNDDCKSLLKIAETLNNLKSKTRSQLYQFNSKNSTSYLRKSNIPDCEIINKCYRSNSSVISSFYINCQSISSCNLNSQKNKCFIITEKLASPENVEKDSEECFENEGDKKIKSFNCDDSSELTEDDLEFLLDNTGFKADQIKKWHSDFVRKCTSGYINFKQFKSSYKNLMPLDLNEKSKHELIYKLFCLFDIDSDGRLNFSEFLVSFWIRCKAPLREKFTWIFNMFDLDRNGILNYNEIRNALKMCLNINDLDELLYQLNNEKSKTMKDMEMENYKSKTFTYYCSKNLNDEESVEKNDVKINLTKKLTLSNTTNCYKNNQMKLSTSCLHSNTCERKYSLFSRTTQLIEDKLNQTIFLLTSLINAKLMNLKDSLTTSISSSSLSSSSFIHNDSEYLISDSYNIESLSSTNSYQIDCSSFKRNYEFESKVHIKREDFLDLCEKYKVFRKLILPIKGFYD